MALLSGVQTQLAPIVPAAGMYSSVGVEDEDVATTAANAPNQGGGEGAPGHPLWCHAQFGLKAKAELAVRIGTLGTGRKAKGNQRKSLINLQFKCLVAMSLFFTHF